MGNLKPVGNRCQVMEQRERENFFFDEPCGKIVFQNSTLCETHLKELLVQFINRNNIDPIGLLNINVLQTILRDNQISFHGQNAQNFEEMKQVSP